MTTAVRCAIRAALRAASTAQLSLRTRNTHARAPPPAEEPEYEIEEILKKRKRKNKEYDPEGEGEDAEPEYVEEYYVKWKGWDGTRASAPSGSRSTASGTSSRRIDCDADGALAPPPKCAAPRKQPQFRLLEH